MTKRGGRRTRAMAIAGAGFTALVTTIVFAVPAGALPARHRDPGGNGPGDGGGDGRPPGVTLPTLPTTLPTLPIPLPPTTTAPPTTDTTEPPTTTGTTEPPTTTGTTQPPTTTGTTQPTSPGTTGTTGTTAPGTSTSGSTSTTAGAGAIAGTPGSSGGGGTGNGPSAGGGFLNVFAPFSSRVRDAARAITLTPATLAPATSPSSASASTAEGGAPSRVAAGPLRHAGSSATQSIAAQAPSLSSATRTDTHDSGINGSLRMLLIVLVTLALLGVLLLPRGSVLFVMGERTDDDDQPRRRWRRAVATAPTSGTPRRR